MSLIYFDQHVTTEESVDRACITCGTLPDERTMFVGDNLHPDSPCVLAQQAAPAQLEAPATPIGDDVLANLLKTAEPSPLEAGAAGTQPAQPAPQ